MPTTITVVRSDGASMTFSSVQWVNADNPIDTLKYEILCSHNWLSEDFKYKIVVDGLEKTVTKVRRVYDVASKEEFAQLYLK